MYNQAGTTTCPSAPGRWDTSALCGNDANHPGLSSVNKAVGTSAHEITQRGILEITPSARNRDRWLCPCYGGIDDASSCDD